MLLFCFFGTVSSNVDDFIIISVDIVDDANNVIIAPLTFECRQQLQFLPFGAHYIGCLLSSACADRGRIQALKWKGRVMGEDNAHKSRVS